MLFGQIFFLAVLLLFHPGHVAISSIEIDNQGMVMVSHKFYMDDFSLLFYHIYEKNIKPVDSVEFSENELSVVNDYMSGAFLISCSENSTLKLDYEGKDQEGEYIWIYYRGQVPQGFVSTFTLTDNIMFDLNTDHTNLVIVTCGSFEQGYTFAYGGKRTEVVRIEDI